MSSRTSVVLAVAVLLFSLAVGASPAGAAPTWAPADEATVHPGVQTETAGAQCTANFVFTSGTNVYIGQAAHCSGTGPATETNGCEAESRPLNTQVEVEGATYPGVMVYNSWLAMQAANEQNENACWYNDFALIRLDPRDHGKVNPTVPFWGGPSAPDATTTFGEEVYSYGNSELRLGLSPLSPKYGTSVGAFGGGWAHIVYTATPGIPGDSGSAFLDENGGALGVLSTIALLPLTGSNTLTDIGKAVAYMESHGGPDVTLVLGTEPFEPLL